VHALRHAHELIVPGGTMVDLHPVTEEQVETRGRVLGVIEEPDFVARDLPNAEARLRDAADAGLYAFEREATFDVLQHFDRPEELVNAKRERLVGQDSLVRRIEGARPPFVLREHVVLRRLRVLPATA
jgi:hypothetical protein